jgi:hypothetical protein
MENNNSTDGLRKLYCEVSTGLNGFRQSNGKVCEHDDESLGSIEEGNSMRHAHLVK